MGGIRRFLQVAVAIVAWVIFALLWWWAFRGRGPAASQIEALVLVVVMALLVAAVTGLWVAYNIGRWRASDRRVVPPAAAYDYSVDVTGRRVEADFADLVQRRYVTIDVESTDEGELKRYTAGSEELSAEEVAACTI